MDLFVQQFVGGLATGGIYASLALALVMIHRATELINFAQGEMAMFSTYIAWTLINVGMPYWAAFFLTIIVSFAVGVLVERVVIRPVEKAPLLTIIVVFIGLLLTFNSLAGWIWTYTIKPFSSPFPDRPFGLFADITVRMHDAGAILVTLLVLILVYLFFRFTPLGLAMRGAALNPESSRLVGIRVGWMLALGWGLAAAIGSVAGMMVAPITFLDPNMMAFVLLYAFAGALLGGINSPGGAVVGGFMVGVLENMAGTYVPFIGNELKLTLALLLIIAVVIFRPSGLFGKPVVVRV
jgi:branched-chain amino acid transport system permease protein|tara:strand:+ start:2104 stop:2988 length:885 start_codon:yes stop_codon:yes gene_type:complete